MIAPLPVHAPDSPSAGLPDRTIDRSSEALHHHLTFDTFGMARIGPIADEAGHHPERPDLCGTIDIRPATRDARGIAGRDVRLAIDAPHPPPVGGRSSPGGAPAPRNGVAATSSWHKLGE